jgi:hypothetical protein
MARKAKELDRERGPLLEREPLQASIGERCIARQLARLEAQQTQDG